MLLYSVLVTLLWVWRRNRPEYNGIKSLLDDQLFNDLTIKCAEKEFKAHKAVLASQSPVFKRMLMTNMTEKESNVIELSDIDPPWFSQSSLLIYIFWNYSQHKDTGYAAAIVVADKYELSHLIAICESNLLSGLVISIMLWNAWFLPTCTTPHI